MSNLFHKNRRLVAIGLLSSLLAASPLQSGWLDRLTASLSSAGQRLQEHPRLTIATIAVSTVAIGLALYQRYRGAAPITVAGSPATNASAITADSGAATNTQIDATVADNAAASNQAATAELEPERLISDLEIIAALTSGNPQEALDMLSQPEFMVRFNLSSVNLGACKFVIQPSERIMPCLYAAGIESATGALVAETFTLLDLAILTNNAVLVDRLLKAGMPPTAITKQTEQWCNTVTDDEETAAAQHSLFNTQLDQIRRLLTAAGTDTAAAKA